MDIEDEVLMALAVDPVLWTVAADLVARIGEDGESVDLYGQAFAVDTLQAYRDGGGSLACAVWAPAAAVRLTLDRVAEGLHDAATRMSPITPTRAALYVAAARLRAALDGGAGAGAPNGG